MRAASSAVRAILLGDIGVSVKGCALIVFSSHGRGVRVGEGVMVGVAVIGVPVMTKSAERLMVSPKKIETR